MDWLYEVLIILSYILAVFRFTHLLWQENGPWDVLDWFRYMVGIRFDEERGEFVSNGTFFAELLTCPLCLSGWISLIAVGMYFADFWLFDIGAAWLGIWGVQLLLFGWKRAV